MGNKRISFADNNGAQNFQKIMRLPLVRPHCHSIVTHLCTYALTLSLFQPDDIKDFALQILKKLI